MSSSIKNPEHCTVVCLNSISTTSKFPLTAASFSASCKKLQMSAMHSLALAVSLSQTLLCSSPR